MLFLADAWQARVAGQRVRNRIRQHLVLWLGVVVVALGYLAARAHVLGPGLLGGAVAAGIAGQTLLGRVLVMAPAALVWLGWLVWPVHLSADYLPNAFVPSAGFGPAQLAGLCVVAALALAAWIAKRRAPGVTVGIVFGAVAASVAASVLVPTGVLLAERLAYLPSVGAALVAGAVWELLSRHRFTWAATAVVLALLAWRTLNRIPVWRDRQRFLAALVHDAPDSYRTHWALGAEAFDHGEFGTGERQMMAAIRIYPGDPGLVQELGEKYLAAGLYSPAARYLSAAYGLDTLSAGVAVRGVFAFLKSSQPDSAAALGMAALRRAPDDAALLAITEEAQLSAGRPRDALALARRLVFVAPGSWVDQQIAGYAAARAGRCDEARARLQRARALAPGGRGPSDALRRLDGGASCGLAR